MAESTKCESYVVGDLVTYVGNVYVPDYMYEYERSLIEMGLGLVIKVVDHPGVNTLNMQYRVYWFRSGATTYISADQLRLAYVKK